MGLDATRVTPRGLAEDISVAPRRLQPLRLGAQLFADALHVRVQRARAHLLRVPPDVLENHVTLDHLALLAGQHMQQLEFNQRQVQRLARGAAASPPTTSNTNGPSLSSVAASAVMEERRSSACTRSTSSFGLKGFAEVIVRALFEARDPVLRLASRREHDDRDVLGLLFRPAVPGRRESRRLPGIMTSSTMAAGSKRCALLTASMPSTASSVSNPGTAQIHGDEVAHILFVVGNQDEWLVRHEQWGICRMVTESLRGNKLGCVTRSSR